MFSNKRAYAPRARQVLALGSAIALEILVGACSADVTRFDFPVFGLTDKGGETGSLPAPPEAMARRGYEDPSSAAPRGAGLGETGGSTPNTGPPPPGAGTGERFASVRDYSPSRAGELAPGSDRYASR